MNNKLDIYKRLILQDKAALLVDLMLLKIEEEILNDIKDEKEKKCINRKKKK